MASVRPGGPGSQEFIAVVDRVKSIESRLKGIKEEIEHRNSERETLLEELSEIRELGDALRADANRVIKA